MQTQIDQLNKCADIAWLIQFAKQRLATCKFDSVEFNWHIKLSDKYSHNVEILEMAIPRLINYYNNQVEKCKLKTQ